MTDRKEIPSGAWSEYWAGARQAGVSADAGAQDPALRDFWLAWFAGRAAADDGGTRILDLACGHGAVTGFAESVGRDDFQISCLDTSQAALDLVKAEHPGVTPICASADDIPLPENSFDHVVSQFGLEYAPMNAAGEVARLLRPGGTVAFIMHLRDGAIFGECRTNRSALDAVNKSGVIAAFVRLIEEHLALRQGRGSRAAYVQADRDLSPAVKAVERIFQEHGREIGGGMIFQIYADIAQMYGKMNAFDPQEVIAWGERASSAMIAWHDRMQSMLDAALDDSDLAAWRARLAAGGVDLEEPGTLSVGETARDGAWVLTGTKRA